MVIGFNYLAYVKLNILDLQNKTYDWLTIYSILGPRHCGFHVFFFVVFFFRFCNSNKLNKMRIGYPSILE